MAKFGGLSNVQRQSTKYKLASREVKTEDTVVDIAGVKIGKGKVVVIAGPCAVESEDQIMKTAKAVKKAGAAILRGGTFKPRTSPYSFQGLGAKGLKLLAKAGKKFSIPVVTEVVSPEDVGLVSEHADMLQIGARNAQNFALLKACGRSKKPVLLKRGLSETVEELLLSAEYILDAGNKNVVLCERGIRTFETATRNTLDINAIPLLKQLTHLPLISDPSHGTGKKGLVTPVGKACIAAGAEGLIVEVHPQPEDAKSDGPQSLNFDQFQVFMNHIRKIAKAEGKSVTTTREG